MNSLYVQAFAGVGLLVVLRAVAEVGSFLYAKFVRAGKDLRKYGKWAVVTGATDGIGKAFADEMARKGMNILLVSRTQSKLDEAAQEMREKYPTVSYEYPEMWINIDDARAQQLVELNINSTNWMTRLVLPGMVDRKKGAVVSIGSGVGTFPAPMLAGYSAAKQYVSMMTKSWAAEYAHIPGLHFQCQTPMFITSKLSKIRKPTMSTPTPQDYAKVAVRAIGYETEVSPYWAHSLQLAVVHAMPDSIRDSYVMGLHRDLNKRALKKKAEKAAQK